MSRTLSSLDSCIRSRKVLFLLEYGSRCAPAEGDPAPITSEPLKLNCANCGSAKVHRKKRHYFEKMFYVEVYQCVDCGHWSKVPGKLSAFFSFAASCPSCGNPHLATLRKRDHIDLMYHNPLSWCQRLLGAPLLHCAYCRLQFYDYRKRLTESTNKSTIKSDATQA